MLQGTVSLIDMLVRKTSVLTIIKQESGRERGREG